MVMTKLRSYIAKRILSVLLKHSTKDRSVFVDGPDLDYGF